MTEWVTVAKSAPRRRIDVPPHPRAHRCSQNAVRQAQRLSRLLGSRLTFVHVLNCDVHDSDALVAAQTLLERAAIGSRFTPRLQAVVGGDRSIPECILETARYTNADLIVIGARGSRDTELITLGSVSLIVASAAEVPIYIVPLTERTAARFEDRWRHAMR
jgi:nucleotide-binding universal stress UspA family protein